MITQHLQQRRLRRLRRTRAKIYGTVERPRLTVRRSLAHIYAQLIDDQRGLTLAAARDQDISAAEQKGKHKTDIAYLVGQLIAERAKAKGLQTAVFDRRDKRYHGRVRAVAEGARAAGLNF